jgi:hypothetical protein
MNIVSTAAGNRHNGNGITCMVADDVCNSELEAMKEYECTGDTVGGSCVCRIEELDCPPEYAVVKKVE